MGPFEYLWLSIFTIFVMVALVRKYPNELGTTIIIFATLFLITYLAAPKMPGLINSLYARVFDASVAQRQMQHALASIFSLGFMAAVFASYAGQTLSFPGKPAPGWKGSVYSLLVGVMNGYLISGTLWYFQDYYQYPIADFGLLYLPLTPTGETIAAFLPPYVVPPAFWGFLVAVMLLFRVRK